MGPASRVRQFPTVIRCMPLRPSGNRAACQENRRSLVSGFENCWVESSVMSTIPSTSWLTGTGSAISIPRRCAMEERASSGLICSPSIAEDFTTSSVNALRLNSDLESLCSVSAASILPTRCPWEYRMSASREVSLSTSQVNLGQSGRSCVHILITAAFVVIIVSITAVFAEIIALFTAKCHIARPGAILMHCTYIHRP